MIELLPTLVSNVAVASGLALVATVVGWTGRYAAPARWIWLAVFLKLVTPPLVTVPIQFSDAWSGKLSEVSSYLNTPRVVVPPIGRPVPPLAAVNDHLGTVPDIEVPTSQPLLAISLVDVVLIVWALGTAWLLMRGIVRYWRMVQLLRLRAEASDEGAQAVRELLQRAPDQFVPGVRLIAVRISPMLFGIGRNTSIVCPRELWLELDQAGRLAFLAHEAAHYLRRDHWVRWIEWVVTSIYWWLPLVVWARLQLERHEEVACDNAALDLLQRQSSKPVRRSYAESLLSVVDFLSETETRVPRLASQMQPTSALEERLHWIMTRQEPDRSWQWPLTAGILLGACALLVHPRVQPWTPSLAYGSSTALSSAAKTDVDATAMVNHANAVSPKGINHPPLELPAAPLGWWNDAPERVWADHQLGKRALRLVAEVGGGVAVSGPNGIQSKFEPRDARALAYVPGNDRLVVGRQDGELHLWDLASARSVSLIGKHAAEITSTGWSATGGLVSSDRQGNIVRWDLQSGEMLATRNLNQAVSNVRWSNDGQEVAALTGNWSIASGQRYMILLRGDSLERKLRLRVPQDAATVHHDEGLGWLAISWSGAIHELKSMRLVGTIPKHHVSGAVLCADLMPEMEPVKVQDRSAIDIGNQTLTPGTLGVRE